MLPLLLEISDLLKKQFKLLPTHLRGSVRKKRVRTEVNGIVRMS